MGGFVALIVWLPKEICITLLGALLYMAEEPKNYEESTAQDSQSKGVVMERFPVRDGYVDEGAIAVIVTVIAGLLFGFLLALVISTYYRPDIGPLIKEAGGLVTSRAASSLAPEPVERLQYLACMLLMPVFLFFSYFCFEKRWSSFPAVARKRINFSATVLLLTFAVFAPLYIYGALGNSEGGFLYVRSGILFSRPWVYAIGVCPILILLAVYAYKPWVRWVGRLLLGPLALFSAVVTFFVSLYNSDSVSDWTYHINPVIYPLAQVLSSKTLLVDCAPLYGLYPHFLEPIFRIVPLSVYSFSMLMAGMLLVCLFSLWFFLSRLVKNEVILYAGFIAAVFYSHIGVKTILFNTRPDPYFQYAPLRMLFPCLLLLLCTDYLRNLGRRWIYGSGFLISGLAILWNPDTGIVVFGAWCLLLVYVEIFERSFAGSLRPILRHMMVALFILTLVYFGYGFFALLRSGVWPDWGMTQKYYKLFSYYGYFMLPMKGLPHVWGIMALIYTISMSISIRGLFRGGDKNFHASIFLLTIVGVGLFAYYQGRSHDYCLISLLCIPILILTILVDRILIGAQGGDKRFYKLLPIGALCFYFCASAAPSVVMKHAVFFYWIKGGLRTSGNGSGGVHSENINFIRMHAKPGERVFILVGGNVDGIYHAESSTASVLDISSSTDWFFKDDINKVINFITTNQSFKVFAIPGEYADLSETFISSYRIVAQDSKTGLALYIPKIRQEH